MALPAIRASVASAITSTPGITGVKGVAKDLKAATSPGALGLNKVKEAADRFEKWDPIKNAAKPGTPLVYGEKIKKGVESYAARLRAQSKVETYLERVK